MNKLSPYALILAPLVLVACSKKVPEAPPPAVVAAAAPAPAPAPAPAAAPAAVDLANMTVEQKEQAKRQAALDFATMEDNYINDPLGQWADTATASGSSGGKNPSSHYLPEHLVGPIDGDAWGNEHDDVGFEWVQLGYARPVNATEVRLVTENGVEAVTKVELQDTEGKWNTIWSGLSDVKRDERGTRTWFVRTFPKTAYKVQAVKYTIANNVHRSSKHFDAAQLIGE